MEQATQSPLQTLTAAELRPIVAQVLDNPHIDSLDWQVSAVGGTGGSLLIGAGVFRLTGSARSDSQIYPWSVILKVYNGAYSTGDSNDAHLNPSAWNYWKREILAYDSGILAELGGNLIAPRCYGITEHPDHEWRIWLEDIQETTPRMWTIERHGVAARHLGQFNGAYLTGHPLPIEQPWFYRGRAHDWIHLVIPMFEGFQQYASTETGQRWLTQNSVDRIQKLLTNHQPLLAMLDRLPVCICHHDAFRRNLLARDGADGTAQTVAIDWSMMGYGGIGTEIGITTAIALSWMEVAGDRASELDRIIFESYLDGLRDVGWQGDTRLARFGYTVEASLVKGVAWAIFICDLLSNAEGIHFVETIIGFPLNEILEQWAIVHSFFLDLGDEALRLADELTIH